MCFNKEPRRLAWFVYGNFCAHQLRSGTPCDVGSQSAGQNDRREFGSVTEDASSEHEMKAFFRALLGGRRKNRRARAVQRRLGQMAIREHDRQGQDSSYLLVHL